MKYAIIAANGHQYKVREGDQIVIDRQTADAGETVTFSDVLMLVDDKKVQIGTPMVDKAKVTAVVDEHVRGKKVRIAKFKAKSRYRKVNGFRPSQSRLTIQKISN